MTSLGNGLFFSRHLLLQGLQTGWQIRQFQRWQWEQSIHQKLGWLQVSRQIGTAFGIAFLGAMLSNRYNVNIHDKITALKVQGLPDVAKLNMISGIQKAGTIAGSLGLSGNSSQNPYAHEPIFSTIQQIARTSFVNGTIDIFKIAGSILAAGAILTLILIRNKDMVHNQDEKK